MLKNIFLKTLRDYRFSLLWWGISLVGLAALYILFYPSIVESSAELTKYMERLPDALKAFIGEDDYASPIGYLNGEIFGLSAPLLFSIFAISIGSFALAGEEEKGTLDVLLSYPTTRSKVILEKFLAMGVLILILGVVFYVALALLIKTQSMDIDFLYLAEATFSASLLAFFFAALAMFLGCLTGKRGMSVGLTSALAIGSYFISTLGKAVDTLEPYRKFTPFFYYNESNPLKNGLDFNHSIVLIVGILALLLFSLLAFQRRDLNI